MIYILSVRAFDVGDTIIVNDESAACQPYYAGLRRVRTTFHQHHREHTHATLPRPRGFSLTRAVEWAHPASPRGHRDDRDAGWDCRQRGCQRDP
jgi:hypothetical protein